jgi:hypothetical protein
MEQDEKKLMEMLKDINVKLKDGKIEDAIAVLSKIIGDEDEPSNDEKMKDAIENALVQIVNQFISAGIPPHVSIPIMTETCTKLFSQVVPPGSCGPMLVK